MNNALHVTALHPSRAAVAAALRWLIGSPDLFRLGSALLRRAPRVRS